MSNHPEVPDPLQLELELHAPDPRFLALVSLRGMLISRLQQKLDEQARLQRQREAHEEWREIRDALRRRIVGQRAGGHWIAAAARRAIARALREGHPRRSDRAAEHTIQGAAQLSRGLGWRLIPGAVDPKPRMDSEPSGMVGGSLARGE